MKMVLREETLEALSLAILDGDSKFEDLVAIVLADPNKFFDCPRCAGRFTAKLLQKVYNDLGVL